MGPRMTEEDRQLVLRLATATKTMAEFSEYCEALANACVDEHGLAFSMLMLKESLLACSKEMASYAKRVAKKL